MQGLVGSALLKSGGSIGGLMKCGVPALMGQGGGYPLDLLSGPALLGGARLKHSKRINIKVQKKVEGAVHYPGFSYFPRYPDQKDPPCEPSKLFMVRRIRSVKKCPWWEKEYIESYKLGSREAVAIVKNTPADNARLYRIKHLVEIKPITLPYGMPDDPKHGFLRDNGQFVSHNLIEGHQCQLEEAEQKVADLRKKSVDGTTLKNRLKIRWYQRW